MAKCLIIPDIHLKIWMLHQAESILETGKYDMAVFLGDLLDDWNRKFDLQLYEEILKRFYGFVKSKNNVFWCYGNHDVSYLWGKNETGFSYAARTIVLQYFKSFEMIMGERLKFIHRIGNILFSHAGLSEIFVEKWYGTIKNDLDALLQEINNSCEMQLWTDDSPIWVRPQYKNFKMYPDDFLQIVGHTPVSEPLLSGNNVLSLDTFSTYRDGRPIGNQRFVWVDTETKEWHYIDE